MTRPLVLNNRRAVTDLPLLTRTCLCEQTRSSDQSPSHDQSPTLARLPPMTSQRPGTWVSSVLSASLDETTSPERYSAPFAPPPPPSINSIISNKIPLFAVRKHSIMTITTTTCDRVHTILSQENPFLSYTSIRFRTKCERLRAWCSQGSYPVVRSLYLSLRDNHDHTHGKERNKSQSADTEA